MRTTELLGEFYRHVAEGDYAAATGMFGDADGASWTIPGTGPVAGTHESRAEIEAALKNLDGGRFGDVKRFIHTVCVGDDEEHVFVQYVLQFVEGEECCEVFAIDAWHVDGDSLVELWTFVEDLYRFDSWTSRQS